jgi:hypothetical protein
VDAVVIASGPRTATFRSLTRGAGDGPYETDSFVIELQVYGLRVERVVFMYRFDWDNLVAFFSDLAESWRGSEGEKSWHSAEGDLSINATVDRLGHWNMEFTVRDGETSSWQADVDGFTINAGEDMASASRSIRAWASGHPAN